MGDLYKVYFKNNNKKFTVIYFADDKHEAKRLFNSEIKNGDEIIKIVKTK